VYSCVLDWRVFASNGAEKMKRFRNSRDGGSKFAPTSPAKNPRSALRARAETLSPSRPKAQQCISIPRWSVEIRTILIDSPAIRNPLQTTENKQQRPFLIDSILPKMGPDETANNSLRPKVT
jgi:hypothetical protein